MRRTGNLTPLHTDFGNNPQDIIVAEYDVPMKNVSKTLFYKYGLLALPKWALIPTAIVSVGLFITLAAIIVTSILSQSKSSVTYSQTCSQTAKCKSEFGLICGSKGKCACGSTQYWYNGKCVAQPTYTQRCNQTTECRTDLGLICSPWDGFCNCPNYTTVQSCDCPSTSYWTGSRCTTRSTYLGSCSTVGASYQCTSNLYCNGSQCSCTTNTQYWNGTAQSCFSIDTYLDACDSNTSYSCNSAVGLSCLSPTLGSRCPLNSSSLSSMCDCANGSYWTGGSCVTKKTYGSSCYWNCECDDSLRLSCEDNICTCPTKYYWISPSGPCSPQKNYSQATCTSTSECDSTQGLTCALVSTGCNCPATSAVGMCDCLSTQFYDTNTSACQTRKLYGESCTTNYTCDASLGLLCQLSFSSATNCSCPTTSQMNMCDCGTTSYWNGITCTQRLSANSSCSFDYQCMTGLYCITNQTDLGVFSDVCRCPIGQYYVNITGCVVSKNYTESCEGSFQCNENSPLTCRYNDTALTCLDSSVNPLPVCDCADNHYYDHATGKCIARLNRSATCTATCECSPPYECISSQCSCLNYYSSLNRTCVDALRYGDNCTSDAECEATSGLFMSCVNGYCGCNSTAVWNGSVCSFELNFRATCSSDADCAGELICRNINCAGGSYCSCNSTSYFSPNTSVCVSCTGSEGGGSEFNRYVINYPKSDICVAVRDQSSSSTSISFATADTLCSSFLSYATGLPPQLLSVHNNTEINCIAAILRGQYNQKKCDQDNYYYLGYSSTNRTFYDGTLYSSAFSNPTIGGSKCVTYCHTGSSSAKLNSDTCSGTGSRKYGAICDYRVT